MRRLMAVFAGCLIACDPGPTPPIESNPANPPPSSVPFEQRILDLTNQLRASGATCGGVAYPPVGTLVLDARLNTAAQGHSVDMATHDYFSHSGLDGSRVRDRMTRAGFTNTGGAENLAAGNADADATFDQWLTSPGHCSNLMLSWVTHMGVGYAYSASSSYQHYWTQVFGRP